MKVPRLRTRSFSLFTVTFCLLILTLGGCSYLFYPKASTYLEQAKGATALETTEKLVAMLEASTQAARDPNGYRAGMDNLHNQLHALDEAMCQVTPQQADTPAYSKATTLRKELWTIFKPLWRHRDDQPVREAHLDLVNARLQDLRESLRALKG
ncbi:MAG: hypothetical protein ACREIM_07430 [Nitrospiraceae bacterium]